MWKSGTPRRISFITALILVSLFQFFCLDARINVRDGLPAPFESDEPFDSAANLNYERISKLYKTSSAKYRYKAQPKYKGIPIFGAYLVFEQDEQDSSVATPVFGTWHSEKDIDINININPQISSSEALELAFASLNITHDGMGDTVLNIYPDEGRFYLVYVVRVSTPSISAKVIVKANSGEIFKTFDGKKGFMTACGLGGNEKIGNVSYCGENAFTINDQYAGQLPILANHFVQIYDNLNKDYWDKSVSTLMRCSFDATAGVYTVDYVYKNGGYCAGCDAFEFVNFLFEIFHQYVGVAPVRDDHMPLKAYVHVGVNWDASNYDDIAGAINFGDGDAGVRYPLSVIDIVGHEIGHAFTAKTSGLINSGESGAIDNFYADLVGESAEYLYYGANDWKVGANSYHSANGADRYFDDPTKDGVSIDSMANYVTGMNPYYASGIYAKAIYLLNTQYAWSMADIFTVFSRANELYWSPNIGFHDALCGVSQCLTDFYKANNTKLLAMQSGLTQAFEAVGVQCERNQTVTQCGANKNTFCVYKVITPSTEKDTSFTIPVAVEKYSWIAGLNITVYVSVRDTACLVPSISLEYEMIDMGSDNEWIRVRDDEQNLIKECGDNHKCEQWNTTCLVDRPLGTSAINPGPDNTYPITIQVAKKVSATLCKNTDFGINSRLKIKCAQNTPAPTVPQPTAAPQTSAPTPVTSAPTIPTINPTPMPTHQLRRDCGENRHCYDVNLYPDQLTTVVPIQNIDENKDVYYDVRFTAVGFDCIRPYYNFEFEPIDYDRSGEFITIYDTNGAEVKTCIDTKKDCDVFTQCLYLEPLTNRIQSNETFNVVVMESKGVDAMCDHDWSINARLTVTCQGGSASPTQIPTDEPTKSPVPPTSYKPSAAPTTMTAIPTAAPTAYYDCGTNALCATVEVVPTADTVTSWKYTLQYGDTNADREYTVFFAVKERNCVNPSLSVRYEQIDYNGIDEYFDVFNTDGASIKRCTASVNQTDTGGCGVFEDCLVDYNLGLNGITSNSTYQIKIFQPVSVDANTCPNTTFSINTDITLKCDANTMNPTVEPTVEPSTSPSQPTSGPTTSPTYYSMPCGPDQYCYHLTLNPEVGVDKEWRVAIQHAGDSTTTIFDIYLVPYHLDCVAPTIGFEFERIDYKSSSANLMLTGKDGFSEKCGGDNVANACGVIATCLTNTSLGINRIKREDSYKLRVVQSNYVDSLCLPDSALTTNAMLTITCNGRTANPTTSPTPEPTVSPTEPTKSPSAPPTTTPTEPSAAPTQSPTFLTQSCGDDRYCVTALIDPPDSGDSTFTVPIQTVIEKTEIVWEIEFVPEVFGCKQPQISFAFEAIDYDNGHEYMNITDAKGALLARCGGGVSRFCDTFRQCYNDSLPVQQIKYGDSYTVYVSVSDTVDATCNHDWAVNARLSITCRNSQSVIPTNVPTPEPTINPTPQSLQPSTAPSANPTVPTVNPTPAPTDRTELCALNHYCVYVDLYPDFDQRTTHDVPLQHADINDPFSFDVIFSVANTQECIDPRITFNMELIDYESTGEYINVTDADDKVLAKCGEVSHARDCGVFVDCFADAPIGEDIQKIGLSDTYTIGVYVTEKCDDSCGTGAINAVLRLSCAKGTMAPTRYPTTPFPTVLTTAPTKFPTVDPTVPTLDPTPSPTWSVLCGDNTYCYDVDIAPSLTAATTWTVPIQMLRSDCTYAAGCFGSTFRIRYRVDRAATNNCVSPRVTFTYETIDYDHSNEYINVTDNSGNVIAECGMEGPARACVFVECFSDIILQNQMQSDEDYVITLYQPRKNVIPMTECSDFALNATLVLQCEAGTAQPSETPTKTPSAAPTGPTAPPTTAQPTTATGIPTPAPTTPPTKRPSKAPTAVTPKPTLRPSVSPTAVTAQPTKAPTYSHQECGSDFFTNKWCYDVPIAPLDDEWTETMIVIQGIDDGKTTSFEFTFHSEYIDCVKPSVTLKYENIDMEGEDEYLEIMDDQQQIFAKCGAIWQCDTWDYCVKNYELNTTNFLAGRNYTITVIGQAAINGWCDHDLTVNAELTLKCNNGIEEVIPDNTGTECGNNKFCFEQIMHPSTLQDTEWSQEIRHLNAEEATTEFEVVFVSKNERCYQPTLQFMYERIDFDQPNEFIDVFDNASVLISRCGAGKVTNECGAFEVCLTGGYALATRRGFIEMSDKYTVTLFESGQVGALCRHEHSYSMNAIVTMSCSAASSTTADTLVTTNTSIAISGSNSFTDELFENVMTARKQEAHLRHEVTYTVNNYDCVRPTFSATTHIKVNAANSQNLWIYNNEMEKIGQCISSNSQICPQSMQCVADYAVDETVLSVGADYTFVIYLILDAADWCDTEDTIKTQLSFQCDGFPSVSPTVAPTEPPTKTVVIDVVTTDRSESNEGDSMENKGGEDGSTTVIVVIVIVVVVIILVAVGYWFYSRGQKKGGVKSGVETEMATAGATGQQVEPMISPDEASPSPDNDGDETRGNYASVDAVDAFAEP